MKAALATLVASWLLLATVRASTFDAGAEHLTSVLWIGDSYPAGTGATSPKTTGYTAQVATAMSWTRYLDARGGTGFTTAGRRAGEKALPDRLAKDRRLYHPDVVIIDAGRHDIPSRSTFQVVRAYYQRVVTAWPGAVVVLVVPWEVDGPKYIAWQPRWSALYGKLAAARSATEIIDPIAQEWFATDGSQAQYKHPGGNVHPNQVGHDYIAQAFVRALGDLGLAPTVSPDPSVPSTPELSVPSTPEPSVPSTPEPSTPSTPEPSVPSTAATS